MPLLIVVKASTYFFFQVEVVFLEPCVGFFFSLFKGLEHKMNIEYLERNQIIVNKNEENEV